jgi:uncharacterized protein
MLETPSAKPLPRQGDPRKFAQQGIDLQGFLPVSELPRLSEALVASDTRAEVVLKFGISDEGKKVVTGTARANLELVCQRCLEPVIVPVVSDIALAIVWSEEEATKLPKYLDPWIAEEGAADLYTMVEDELLLSMPAVAYHEEPCVESTLFSSGEPATEKVEKNPFQILEQLKGSPKS